MSRARRAVTAVEGTHRPRGRVVVTDVRGGRPASGGTRRSLCRHTVQGVTLPRRGHGGSAFAITAAPCSLLYSSRALPLQCLCRVLLWSPCKRA
ncbi:hypothetical protein HPP92_012795 [Vanilla planifolia]|uniref:Uncharacterized protein n=1 Tax=Vanilla planifolia TaxID=51239 RepID=A0A835V007_VANPL|nr:hypothetical protein HPP92_013221 [Vanilla planifolia]KAG0478076.1 hypothetical protein HPP92_012795 [Vanilla planifolia]